jgi:hypothetical protein
MIRNKKVVLNISENIQLPNVPTKSVYRSKSNALGNSIYSINIKGFRGLPHELYNMDTPFDDKVTTTLLMKRSQLRMVIS